MKPYPSWFDEIDTEPLNIIVRIDVEKKTGVVRKGDERFPVKLMDWLLPGIKLLDIVTVEEIDGELTVTDYHFNHEVTASIHNTYQDNYDDMIVDERGVPL